jgi:hypothetical protein
MFKPMRRPVERLFIDGDRSGFYLFQESLTATAVPEERVCHRSGNTTYLCLEVSR